MIRNILVGLDGSECSQRAVELAIGWAKAFNARVTGLAILDEPSIRRAEALPLGAGAIRHERDEARMEDAKRRIYGFMQAFAIAATEAGLEDSHVMRSGVPHEEIAHEAQTHDLIVLGKETHFHFETQQTPDETLSLLLKHIPRPVVAAPCVAPPADGKVMVAYDGSLQAARTLQLFVTSGLAKAVAKEPIHVVSVADAAAAEQQADQAVAYLRLHGLEAQADALPSNGKVAETLLAAAESLPAGLIVMGAYGQPTLREFLFGSVTQALINHSPAPLFLYH